MARKKEKGEPARTEDGVEERRIISPRAEASDSGELLLKAGVHMAIAQLAINEHSSGI